MQPILVLSAVEQEISLIARSLDAVRVRSHRYPPTFKGSLGDSPVILSHSGIGKANAACAAALLIQRWRPSLIINTGSAGAYPESGLRVGDLALASSEIFADEGVATPKGWESMERIGIPLLELRGNRYYNEIPLSFSATEKAFQFASALELQARRGRFLTVSTCSGTSKRGKELFDQYGGICENMEGAAVALAALKLGVDSLEVRGVSNMVEDRNMKRWNIPLAHEQAQRFVLSFLGNCLP